MSDDTDNEPEDRDESDEETAESAEERAAEEKPAAPKKARKKAAWCAVTRIERYSADARRLPIEEPCRVLPEGAVAWEERFKSIDPAAMQRLWGGGRYRVQWHYLSGQIARRDAPVDIPGESMPADCDLTRAAEPKGEPAPSPKPESPEPEAMPPGLPPELGQLGSLLSLFEFFEARAERRMRGQIDLLRAQNDAYVRQLETMQSGALAREQERATMALREQEQRHKRDREHLAELARQTREATDIEAVLGRVEKLEAESDEDPEWLKKLPDLIVQAMRPRQAGAR